MIDEKSLRRAEFLDGQPIRLADGTFWTLPMPPAVDTPENIGEGPPVCDVFGPRYSAILDAIREAEDDAEVLRAELTLAIFLLRRNYDLDRIGLRSLLHFDNPEELAQMQRTMSVVASAHLRSFHSRRRPLEGGVERRWGRSALIRAFST
jgi:hypothetical protein